VTQVRTTYLRYMGGVYRLADDAPQLVGIPADSIKVQLPDVRQKVGYSCGASCLQSIARYFGAAPLEEEDYFVRLTEMDSRVGSHPDQILTAAAKLGLTTAYREDMSYDDLRAFLEKRRPVLLTLQAYGDNYESAELDYSEIWKEGHWVAAIGFDAAGVFFEDPVLEAIRGYLSYPELDKRWHDTVRHGKQVSRVGIAMWLDQAPSASFYESFAQRIP
jgi:predicted double-glycine peptidase